MFKETDSSKKLQLDSLHRDQARTIQTKSDHSIISDQNSFNRKPRTRSRFGYRHRYRHTDLSVGLSACADCASGSGPFQSGDNCLVLRRDPFPVLGIGIGIGMGVGQGCREGGDVHAGKLGVNERPRADHAPRLGDRGLAKCSMDGVWKQCVWVALGLAKETVRTEAHLTSTANLSSVGLGT